MQKVRVVLALASVLVLSLATAGGFKPNPKHPGYSFTDPIPLCPFKVCRNTGK